MLPMPATRTLPFTRHLAVHRQRFNLFWREKETMPGLTHHAEIAARIVFKNNGQMHLVIEVRLDGLDNRDFSLQCHVENVGTLLRPNAHAIACAERDTKDGDTFQSGAFLFRTPLTHCP